MRFDFSPCFIVALCLAGIASASAQPVVTQSGSSPLTVGSSLEATADPVIPRPNTKHCEVTLLTNQAFADFNNKTFSFTPPAACPGPWAKVIFTGDLSIQAGVQYDRTGQVFLGGVNIFFGTTAEPLASQTDAWHVERDLTDYASLLRTPQTGYASLGNIVSVADGLNSTILGTFKIEFYQADFIHPAPLVADAVIPIQSNGNSSFQINSSTMQVVQSLTLPQNTEAAYLDIVAQSQNAEEQWFFCVPNEIAAPLDDCGNTAFRQVEITIDGKPAGAAPVYPWIYTGGLDPGLWVPIPGVQTLNLEPYRIDVTPFAGMLDDGQPHDVGVSLFNAYSYFTVTAQLLVYQDHGRDHVTGALTEDTLTTPDPAVTDTVTLDANGLGSGVATVSNDTHFVIAGYVDTSHGRVQTTVAQDLNYKSAANITNSSTAYIQDNVNTSTLHAVTTTQDGFLIKTKDVELSYPITVGYDEELETNGDIAVTSSVNQGYRREETDLLQGFRVFHSVMSNEVVPADTALFVPTPTGYGLGQNSNQSSKQTYTYQDSFGGCYDRTLTVAANKLTGVSDGALCKKHGWH